MSDGSNQGARAWHLRLRHAFRREKLFKRAVAKIRRTIHDPVPARDRLLAMVKTRDPELIAKLLRLLRSRRGRAVPAADRIEVLTRLVLTHGALPGPLRKRARARIAAAWASGASEMSGGRAGQAEAVPRAPMQATAQAILKIAGGRQKLSFRTGEATEVVVDDAICAFVAANGTGTEAAKTGSKTGSKAAAKARANAAEDMLALERITLAQRMIDTALAEAPDAPELLSVEAQLLLRLGRFAAARTAAEAALARHPKLTQARTALARSHSYDGRPAEAVLAMTSGHGLSKPLTVETARMALALGWRGVAEDHVGVNPALRQLSEQRAKVFPRTAPPRFCVRLLPDQPGDSADAPDTEAIRAACGDACLGVASVAEGALDCDDDAEWCLLFVPGCDLARPGVAARVLDQAWEFTSVIRVFRGAPAAGALAGLAIRRDILAALGAGDLATLDARAERLVKSQIAVIGG